MPLILVLLVLVPVVGAQDAPPADAPAFEPSATLVTYLDTLEATTSDLRGLMLDGEITRLFPTPESVAAYIRETYEAEFTDEFVFTETQFYRAFDFFTDDVDLREMYIDLLDDGVAGFYETETQEMNVLLLSGEEPGDELPFLEATTYVHEYVHALQDANFDLEALLEGIPDDNADRALATLSLVEGDATLIMQEYMIVAVRENPMAALSMLGSDALLAAQESMANVPNILVEELNFPYLTGLEFVMALREAGGYAAIDAAFDAPPVSTEQIIHPQTYIDGEMPVDVVLNETADMLPADWSMLYERTMGEFYLRQYLNTQVAGRMASMAAAGWGGDRYQLYIREGDDALAWVLKLVTDTPDDATQFTEAYTRFAQGRTSTQPVTVDSATCWPGEALVLCMVQNADDTITVARVPADMGQTFALDLLAMQE